MGFLNLFLDLEQVLTGDIPRGLQCEVKSEYLSGGFEIFLYKNVFIVMRRTGDNFMSAKVG